MSAQTDIAADLTRILGAKSDLKTSIEGKGVTVPSATKIDGYAALVDQIQQGGGGVPDPDADVRFFDYDGTLLYTYSAADFANLAELPANPSHQGLTAQGWNWTLADAKAYVASYGFLDIGQNYITSDGKTRFYITLLNGRLSVSLNLNQSAANGITIDWGDGSATETNSGTGDLAPAFSHTYASAGDYVITFDVTSGTMKIGAGNANPLIAAPLAIASALKKIELGNNVAFNDYALRGAPNSYRVGPEYMSVPASFTTLGFYGLKLTRLKYIVIPPSITVIPQGCFYGSAISGISLPNGTTLGESSCGGCDLLQRIMLPVTQTTLRTGALSQCGSLEKVIAPGLNSVGQICFLYDRKLTSLVTGGIKDTGVQALREVALTSFAFAIGTTAIGQMALYGVPLKQLTLPAGLLTINASAFAGNYDLSELNIPDTVTTIGNSAFSGLTSLVSVSLGTGVTSLGSQCFSNCVSLGILRIKATTPPTIAADTFSGLPADCTIYVPSASLATYQGATNWSTYASQMVGE